MAYTVDQFVGDLDRITHEETDATTITERIVGPTDISEVRALTQALLG